MVLKPEEFGVSLRVGFDVVKIGGFEVFCEEILKMVTRDWFVERALSALFALWFGLFSNFSHVFHLFVEELLLSILFFTQSSLDLKLLLDIKLLCNLFSLLKNLFSRSYESCESYLNLFLCFLLGMIRQDLCVREQDHLLLRNWVLCHILNESQLLCHKVFLRMHQLPISREIQREVSLK